MATVKVAIDVIYTKYMDVEVPDIKGTEDADIIEQAVGKELNALPPEVNGFFYNWESWEEV